MKKQIKAFRSETMQRLGFSVTSLIVFGGMALGLSARAPVGNLPQQEILSPASLRPSAATHETLAGMRGMIEFRNPNEITPRIETVSPAPPTRSSFTATWDSVSSAKGYFLDVSTSNSFSSYVDGYHDLDVHNVNGRTVTGLNPGTTYYYRVRPYTDTGSAGYSNVTAATTEPSTGLIIQATFDNSITSDPNAAAIEAMINRAIGIYESMFRDPITIGILFRYSDVGPEPSATPYPDGLLSESRSAIYTVAWNDFTSALRADAQTGNDNVANASLPGNSLSANIALSSANGRAVLLDTPPAMLADGTIGQAGPYDGIVSLNSAQLFWFTRPLFSGSFDAQRAVEHEMDEVMGLGSYLNGVRQCPSYEAESSDNILRGGAGIQFCQTCSGGEKVVYVGNNSGTLQFNGITADATHSYVITIWYTNGAGTRYALLSVNGGPGTPVSFPSTGSFQTVGSVQRTITLNVGSNNTLEFSNPITGSWAPDFDRISVNCTNARGNDLRPQDLFSWSSRGARNVTSSGTRYFSINGGSTNIVGFNQTPPGDFGDWLSEACPQTHPYVQNAFGCPNQSSDISPVSPEGINLDVIGYDLVNAVVSTSAATNVTSSSATLNGTVNPNGLTTSVHFEYGTTTSYGLSTAAHSYSGTTTQNVSASVTGLSPSTTYHFRLVATNSGGTIYGGDRTFRTLTPTGTPGVTTNPATNVASFSATLNGSVYPHGLTTTVYFQYGTTTSYGFTTSLQTRTGNTYQSISANISGLTPNTTYHYRIVATNSDGTRYGGDRTFSTLSPTGSPRVTTNPATNVASHSATLNGTVDPHGLITSVHFEYGRSTNYGAMTASQTRTGNTYQNMNASISGLTANTTYHFRIVATNSGGTTRGSDRSFTTQP